MSQVRLHRLHHRFGRPLAALTLICLGFVFFAANFHTHQDPAADGTRGIAFYSLSVPERPAVDPAHAGLPVLVADAEDRCPLCLWKSSHKTFGTTGGWDPVITMVPEQPATPPASSPTPVALSGFSSRAPPTASV